MSHVAFVCRAWAGRSFGGERAVFGIFQFVGRNNSVGDPTSLLCHQAGAGIKAKNEKSLFLVFDGKKLNV